MRNKIIIGALLFVGLASIAYAAFSQSLTISGTGTTNPDWDVKITGITQTVATNATDATTPTFTDTSATFDVELSQPGATATYEVTVENQGSIDAVLDSITDLTTINAASPTDITFTVSGVAVNDSLPASGTHTAIVTVAWNAASTVETEQTKTATITLDYVQD